MRASEIAKTETGRAPTRCGAFRARALGRIARLSSTVAVLSLAAPGFGQEREDVGPIPASLLFSDRAPREPALSPDGEWIGYAQLDHAGDSLSITPAGGGDPLQLLLLPRGDLQAWRWAENGEQVILTLGGREATRQLFALDIEREPDLDASGGITFQPRAGQLISLTPGSALDARVIASDAWNRDEILVAITAAPPLASGVRRVNTRTGASRMVEESSRARIGEDAPEYFAGGGLELRSASRPTPTGGLTAVFRDSVRETWIELGRWEMPDALASRVLGVTGDGRTFYVADSRGRSAAALHALSVDVSGRMTYDILAEHALADLSEVAYHPRSGHAQAAAFDLLRREWVVIDQSVRADWTVLEELAGDGSFSIVSRDRGDRRWIVELLGGDRPPSHLLYDRREKRASPLFADAGEAVEVDPLPTTALSITARDGLKLPCYLTLPHGAGGRRIPMVLIVHDGPWSRAGPGFDPLHQWLASRGYGAISVNYRGSAGFGREFAQLGHREWAGAIQDDLIDAALWLVEERVAHPDRIAILGEGFGGYAALTSMAATPDFFAAGIAIDPIVDLAAMAQELASDRERALFSARVASLEDVAQLAILSPINHVDSITRPLLLARTLETSAIAPGHLETFAASLQSRGVPLRTIDVAAADLPSRNARWIAVLEEIDRLLEATIGGGAAERSLGVMEDQSAGGRD